MNIRELKDKHVLVIGLGKTGLAAVDCLVKHGAIVHCYDDRKNIADKNVMIHTSIPDIDMDKIDEVVVSPGVNFFWPIAHKLVQIARRKFIPMCSDLDIFLQLLNDRQKVISVTGTNGKSTTVSLIYHVLKENGENVEIGGNIGNPLLNLRTDADAYVLELSSYQLELTNNVRFSTAVLLNITPDHLGRHGGLHGYISAKEKVFADSATRCVIGVDDSYSLEIYNFIKQYRSDVVPISGIRVPDNGIGWKNGKMFDNRNCEYILGHVEHLDGEHNRQNIAAAYAAASVTDKQFSAALNSFRGLEHRQEIRKHGSIIFVNDSKATNAEAAEPAIKRFLDSDIIWIVGGRAKEGGITNLSKYFRKIKSIYLIGEAADDFAAELDKFDVCYQKVQTLHNAVIAAYNECDEHEQPVILFSPACASFDQFSSFEERGRVFKKLVDDVIKGNI